MLLTIVLAALAAMGLLCIAKWLCAALLDSIEDENVFCVVRLNCDAAQTEQTVKSCLRLQKERSLRGKLLFVDGGLSPEAQNVTERLLRNRENALLCSESQLNELLKWEREDLGARTDRR